MSILDLEHRLAKRVTCGWNHCRSIDQTRRHAEDPLYQTSSNSLRFCGIVPAQMGTG
jgi:hypothetical protein